MTDQWLDVRWPDDGGVKGFLVGAAVSAFITAAFMGAINFLVAVGTGGTGPAFDHLPELWALAGASAGLARSSYRQVLGNSRVGMMISLVGSVCVGTVILVSSASGGTESLAPWSAIVVVIAATALSCGALQFLDLRMPPPRLAADGGRRGALLAVAAAGLVAMVCLPAIGATATAWEPPLPVVAGFFGAQGLLVGAAIYSRSASQETLARQLIDVVSVGVSWVLVVAMAVF